jgi:uncharacterized protein (TIGR02246 family)
LLLALPTFAAAQVSPLKPPAAAGVKPGGTKPAVPGKAASAANPEDGVRQAIAAYGKALAEGDFQAMAKFWTADGNYTDPAGRRVKAREALEKGAPKGSNPPLALETQSLRMITPEVALEDGVCELTPAGEKPLFRGHYSALWVKQQGSWLLSSLRESLAPPPSHVEQLGSLDWLVGDWEADDDGATVTVTCKWSDNKMYLLREIVVERDERVIHSVTQRIAWDPLTRRLKGWTFDADGSLGESLWTKHRDHWVVQTSGVSRNGQTTSARNTYSDITADGFVLRSFDAQVGSESKPKFELHFKRLPADQ